MRQVQTDERNWKGSKCKERFGCTTLSSSTEGRKRMVIFKWKCSEMWNGWYQLCTYFWSPKSTTVHHALIFPEVNYKRYMYVYNLGIHNVGNAIRTMYMWAECIASRGSQEIASWLIRHIKSVASDKIVIILYSDSCTSQSWNIKLALSLIKMTATHW